MTKPDEELIRQMDEKDQKDSEKLTGNRKEKIQDIYKEAVQRNGEALKKLSEN